MYREEGRGRPAESKRDVRPDLRDRDVYRGRDGGYPSRVRERSPPRDAPVRQYDSYEREGYDNAGRREPPRPVDRPTGMPRRDNIYNAQTPPGPRDSRLNDGEWFCEKCNGRNFARRANCFQCGADRPRLGVEYNAPAPRRQYDYHGYPDREYENRDASAPRYPQPSSYDGYRDERDRREYYDARGPPAPPTYRGERRDERPFAGRGYDPWSDRRPADDRREPARPYPQDRVQEARPYPAYDERDRRDERERRGDRVDVERRGERDRRDVCERRDDRVEVRDRHDDRERRDDRVDDRQGRDDGDKHSRERTVYGRRVLREGDWICSACHYHNFKGREMCNRCGAKMDANAIVGPSAPQHESQQSASEPVNQSSGQVENVPSDNNREEGEAWGNVPESADVVHLE